MLPDLLLEKEICRPGFFLHTHRGQVIEIDAFAAGFPEILNLYKSLLDQGIDKEVDLARLIPSREESSRWVVSGDLSISRKIRSTSSFSS